MEVRRIILHAKTQIIIDGAQSGHDVFFYYFDCDGFRHVWEKLWRVVGHLAIQKLMIDVIGEPFATLRH